jgi:hypothetical protein
MQLLRLAEINLDDAVEDAARANYEQWRSEQEDIAAEPFWEALSAAERDTFREWQRVPLQAALSSLVTQVRTQIATDIETELVCGCITAVENDALDLAVVGWPQVKALGVHQICWWGWQAARIALGQ